MAKLTDFTSEKKALYNRYFSESFKKKIVRDLERNHTTPREVQREYEVSRTAVYKWIYKYSAMKKKGIRQVVEPLSDSRKITDLKEQVRELQRMLGEKQILIEFKDKQIEIAEEMYGVDIKKKLGSKTVTWFWFNRSKHSWKMNQLYRSIGTTKQNVHQQLDRYRLQGEEAGQLVMVIRQVREDHPAMGALNLYLRMKPKTIGRDRFIRLYNENNFKIRRIKNFRKTTDSNGVIRFPNLIEFWELTGVNQVWVSDITYYEIDGRFYYLTFIMDLFSRKIKGYKASLTLRTMDTTIPALKMAFQYLKPGEKPIFHSDGGGQYYCKEFLTLTEGKVLNSMCDTVYENPHAERVNGTIKNSYLKGYAPSNFSQLEKMLKKAVFMYNSEKPHDALGKLTPDYFESLYGHYSQKPQLLTKEKRSKKENFTTTFNLN